MFNCVLLSLAIQEEKGHDWSFFQYRTSFLVGSFSFLFIPRVEYKTPSRGKMYELIREFCLKNIIRVYFSCEYLD